MWGDLERACLLDPSDPLVSALFQVTGPTHIPWQDPVWDELLYGYNVWVHIEAPSSYETNDYYHVSEFQQSTTINNNNNNNNVGTNGTNSSSIISRACQLTAQYSIRTSNLAALTMNVTRTIQDLNKAIYQSVEVDTHAAVAISSKTTTPINNNYPSSSGYTTKFDTTTTTSYDGNNNNNNTISHNSSVTAFSNRISLVGKARTVAGSLNLLRILSHATIQHHSHVVPFLNQSSSSSQNGGNINRIISSSHPTLVSDDDPIREAFTYKFQDTTIGRYGLRKNEMNNNNTVTGVGYDLVSSLLELIVCSSYILPSSSIDIPELYDVIVQVQQLLLVLFSTQLYRPMVSSFQRRNEQQQQLDGTTTTSLPIQMRTGYFWNVYSQLSLKSSLSLSSHQFLSVLLKWQMERPVAPLKSIQYYRSTLTQQVVNVTNTKFYHNKIGSDGLYEGCNIVQACSPILSNNNNKGEYNGPGFDNNKSSSHDNHDTILERNLMSHLRKESTIPTHSSYFSSNMHENHHQQQRHYHHHHPRTSSESILDATIGVLELSSNILLMPIRLISIALGFISGTGQGGKHHKLDHTQQIMQKRFQSTHLNRTKDVIWLSDSPISDLSTCILLLLTNNERDQGVLSSSSSKNDTSSFDDNLSTTSENLDLDSNNSFRNELHRLVDVRWEYSDESESSKHSTENQIHRNNDVSTQHWQQQQQHHQQQQLGNDKIPNVIPAVKRNVMINFEALFTSFGRTVHTEPGALLLYTLLQASPSFAEYVAVRSDIDTIVLPLLRTLYFATALRYTPGIVTTKSILPKEKTKAKKNMTKKSGLITSPHSLLHRSGSHGSISDMPNGFENNTDTQQHTTNSDTKSILNFPFRSQSQLYVIVILLLLFSQDTSFGSDAFRRIQIQTVPWYKERHLKNINLGSVLLLSLLRALVFNLNRMNDPFLLSNCCAVLMNLAPSTVDIHEYAAMRLVSVSVSCIKRYFVLRKQHPVGSEEADETLSTSVAQYGEVSRALLHFMKLALSYKKIDKNVQLVYAMVYHRADFQRLFHDNVSPFRKREIDRLQIVSNCAAELIEKNDNTRTAVKALHVLTENMDIVKEAVSHTEVHSRCHDSKSTMTTDDYGGGSEDFLFTYEEEADPEVFFVPYVWEVIVCTITAASVEWNKNRIEVFPLLEIDNNLIRKDEEDEDASLDDNDDDSLGNSDDTSHRESVIPQFARDITDIV